MDTSEEEKNNNGNGYVLAGKYNYSLEDILKDNEETNYLFIYAISNDVYDFIHSLSVVISFKLIMFLSVFLHIIICFLLLTYIYFTVN